MEFDYEKFKENYEKEHSIICPHCKHKQDNIIMYNHVSYWGEDGDKECYCDECGEKFLVEEKVDRTFVEKIIHNKD